MFSKTNTNVVNRYIIYKDTCYKILVNNFIMIKID